MLDTSEQRRGTNWKARINVASGGVFVYAIAQATHPANLHTFADIPADRDLDTDSNKHRHADDHAYAINYPYTNLYAHAEQHAPPDDHVYAINYLHAE